MKQAALDVRTIDRECSVFCRYLIGQEPNDYVKKKYREAHRHAVLADVDQSHPSDSVLVKVAGISPWTAKVIDVYARVFRQSSLVRKKLVLLLAILESCAPSHAHFDSVDSNSVSVLFLRSLHRCLTFALLLVVAALVILPLELVARGSARSIVMWLPRHG